MRKLATECIEETQDWIFDTCYRRKNRLLQAAVSNKHAGIKGMPVLTQCEKELVMKILMEMRGKGTRKHEEAHRTGKLQFCKAPLRYGLQADPIEARSGSLTDWTNAPAANVIFGTAAPKTLCEVYCPECGQRKCTKGLKLQKLTTFSNLRCEGCTGVISAKKWSCTCGFKWKKCHVHESPDFSQKVYGPKRSRPSDIKGADIPMPKFRKGNSVHEFYSCQLEQPAARNCIALPPGGKLASRFPHLVKRAATDLRVAPG